MRSLNKNLGLVFLQALFWCGSILAQDNQVKKADEDAPLTNSLVNGRAVYEDTGLPAARQRVQLIPSQLLSRPQARYGIPTAITNENGEFVLRRVAAGEYYVFPQPVDNHSGGSSVFPFISRSSDSAADVARVEQFKKDYTRIAVDGLNNLTVNLRVANPHFGSISGRILDATGTPAGQARVHLVSKGENVFGFSMLSDQQGQYKMFGLPAGEYIISASPPIKTPADANRRSYEGILGATFFPSSLESGNSPPVVVFADRDTGNIDITLQARTLHNLAGTIVYGDARQAVANAVVRLTPVTVSGQSVTKPGIEGAMSHYISATDKSGRWSIANVPDGNYQLRVDSASGGAEPTQRFFAHEQDVKVEGDVEDLLIEVSSGARVSGTVTMEGDGAYLTFINIGAARFKGNAVSHVRLERTGNFTLTAVAPGEVTLSAFLSPPDKFYVKSIEAKGIDLLRTNLNVTEGEEVKDMRIVVSSAVGVISGRVLSEKDDKPSKGINVMLRRVGKGQPRLFGGKLSSTTDENGNYLVSAGPGVYLVLVWRASDGPAAFGAALEKASREQGAGLTLLPNDRKQLNLRVP